MSDFLELQHLIGFSGVTNATFINSSQIAYPIGSQLIVVSLEDPHDQIFINEHMSDISKIHCSKRFLISASNELIVVYDIQNKSLFFEKLPYAALVRSLDISEDDCFLLAATDSSCWIWNITTDNKLQMVGALGGNSVVYDERESGYCIAKWLPLSVEMRSKRRKTYEFIIHSRDRSVERLVWNYDSRSMQYNIESRTRLQLPGRIAGLKRSVGDAVTFRDSQDQAWLVIGTESGEAMVYNASMNVYRAAVIACSGGVLSMELLSHGSEVEIAVGGGDGSIRILRGFDTKWDSVQKAQSKGRVTSISLYQNSLLCGSDDGSLCLYNCITTRDQLQLIRTISTSHRAAIRDTIFSPTSNDYFITCSDDGSLRRWDLNDYSMTHIFFAPRGVKFLKCVFANDDEILVGCSDGFIRSYSLLKNDLNWQIVNAHRGGVTALTITSTYICSGGEDACIRLWSPHSRELIGQFTGEHTKTVTSLIIDFKTPYLLHSSSMDRSVCTFDLRQNRRLMNHASSSKSHRSFTTLTQRISGDNELISGSSDGMISFWDSYFRDAIYQFSIENGVPVNSVHISPKRGVFLATAGEDGYLHLWKIHTTLVQGQSQYQVEKMAESKVHSSPICAVKWSHDEKQIITVAGDGSIGVWSWFFE